MKKLMIILFSVVLVSVQGLQSSLEVQASTPITITSSGMITASGTYYINDVSGLVALSDYFDSDVDSQGYTFILTNNINLTGINWKPIGRVSGNIEGLNTIFMGTFDGSGFTISNVDIDRAGQDYNGLFGAVLGATIKNVTLENVTIGNVSNPVGKYTGALVGNAAGATIEDVTVSGTLSVYGTGLVGGLVGKASASLTLDSSIIRSRIISQNITVINHGDDTGGFVGRLVRESGATGTISIDESFITTTTLTLTGAEYVGGFIGYNEGILSDVTLTTEDITISGIKSLGGLIGSNRTAGVIQNSNFVTSGINTIQGNERIGGVIGYNRGTFDSGLAEFNIFNISGVKLIGGFVGENRGEIKRVIFDTISLNIDTLVSTTLVDSDVGGFVGLNDRSSALIEKVQYSSVDSLIRLVPQVGNIAIMQSAGGFAGRSDNGRIIDINYNVTGFLTLSGFGLTNTGGFIGDGKDMLIDTVVMNLSGIAINNINTGVAGFAGRLRSSELSGIEMLFSGLTTIQGISLLGGVIGLAQNTSIDNVHSTFDQLHVTGGFNTYGGFVGEFSSNDINSSSLTANEILVSSTNNVNAVIGGFVGKLEQGIISDSPIIADVLTVSGASIVGGYVGEMISSEISTSPITPDVTLTTRGPSITRTSSGIVTVPEEIFARRASFIEGEPTQYVGLFIGVCTSNDCSFSSTVSNPPAPTPPPTTTPPSGGTGNSSQGTPVLRPLVSELFIEVEDVVMEYGEVIELPTAVAYELFGFTRTDLSNQVVRSGSAGPGVGVYPITYTITYEGVTLSKSIEVRIVDTVAPVIVYTGVTEVYVNDEFEPSFETSDNAPGVVTVEIIELPNVTLVGSTQLIAVATDASGNQTRIEVPITVLQERIEIQEVRVNQANLLFVLNSKEIDIDSTTFYTVVAETQPSVTSASWMPYTSQTYEATSANQFVFVKAKDANGTIILGSPVPLSYQAPAVRLDPVLPSEPVLSPDSNFGLVGVLALGGAAVAGLSVVYWQRQWIADFGSRFARAKDYLNKHKKFSLTAFFILFGLRREYKVLFYDDEELVSEQRVKRGDDAKAPFKAKWDQPFVDVKDNLIIHRVK